MRRDIEKSIRCLIEHVFGFRDRDSVYTPVLTFPAKRQVVAPFLPPLRDIVAASRLALDLNIANRGAVGDCVGYLHTICKCAWRGEYVGENGRCGAIGL